MTDPTPNFIQRLSGITLSDNKKLAMRERLFAYMEMHPVIESPQTASGFSTFFAFASSRRFSVYAATFLVLIIAGGSVTLAAEGSAPGDALYDVKVHLNEPVMTALATSNDGQARVAAKIAIRRANEAVVLATRGTLTEARRAYLEDTFTKSVEKATEKADTLATNGSPERATAVKEDLAANLAGEAQALGAVATTQKDGDKDRVENLLAVVVASSDAIGETGQGDALAASFGGGDAGDNEEEPVVATLSAKMAGSATTTAPHAFRATALKGSVATTSTTTDERLKALLARRALRRLHLSATTTLESLRAQKNFGTLSLPSVQVDSALPALPQSVAPATVLTTGPKALED